VSNSRGSATSTMNLTVTSTAVAPTITRQPSTVAAKIKDNVSFTVTATGSTPRYYQWRRNGVNLGFATPNDTYTLTEVQPGDAATYSVIVSNGGGNVTSADAVLTVAAAAATA